jgi:hypothetical protein
MQDFLPRFKQKFAQSFTVFWILCAFGSSSFSLPSSIGCARSSGGQGRRHCAGDAKFVFEPYIAMKMLANFPPL